MGLMRIQQAQPYTPPESRGLAAAVGRAIWYPLHQGSGATVACGLGNGPTLSLNGSEGTIWSANFGGATPDGTTHRFVSPADEAYIRELCRLDNMLGQQILIGYELQTDGAMATNETALCWGRLDTAAGSAGGWAVNLASTTQAQLVTHGGNGASGAVFSAFPNSTHAGITDRYLAVISIISLEAGILDATRHSWRVGAGVQPPGTVSGIDLESLGGAAPAGDSASRLTLLARQTGTSGWDRHLGATAGSNGKINNVWVARLPEVIAGLAEKCLLDLAAAPREFPISLRA